MTCPTEHANAIITTFDNGTAHFPSSDSLNHHNNQGDPSPPANKTDRSNSVVHSALNKFEPKQNPQLANQPPNSSGQKDPEEPPRLSYITMYETSRNRRLSSHTGGIGAIVGKFNSAIKDHELKQCLNPFSNSFDPEFANSNRPDPSDALNYGRPVRGSKTDIRAQEAARHIQREVEHLLDLIRSQGDTDQDNGLTFVHFGKLFSLYNNISDKLVGILLRARRQGLIAFQGEMLYQRRDEAEPIYLLYDGSGSRSEAPLTETQTGERLEELREQNVHILGGGGDRRSKLDNARLKSRSTSPSNHIPPLPHPKVSSSTTSKANQK